MTDAHPIYLIDGHNLLYKAHFTFIKHPLINRKNRDVSVSYGFTRMLFGLLKEHSPSHLAIAFDRKGPTFRHELYQQYKLNRPPMPAPIADNLPIIRKLVTAFGIPILEQEGYEADDILGSFVERFRRSGHPIFLITGDKDMLQLVEGNVSVLTARTGLSDLIMNRREQVIEKYGIPPELMIDYFSLVGDAIDNVPGIPGIGPKTAVKLLVEFGSLDRILEESDRIESEKLREKVRENAEFARLSRRLIALKTDADLPESLEAYAIQPRDDDTLRTIFEDLEFTTMLTELAPSTAPIQATEYMILTERYELVEFARRIHHFQRCAIALIRSEADPMTARPVGLSVSCEPGSAVYIPIAGQTLEKGIPLDIIRQILAPALSDARIRKSGHNIKSDRLVLSRHGIEINGYEMDTHIAAYLLNAGRRDAELVTLVQDHFNIRPPALEGSSTIQLPGTTQEEVADRANPIAEWSLQLAPELHTALEREGMLPLFRDIELPLVDVLIEMQRSGIRIDPHQLTEQSRAVGAMLARLEDEIYCMAGDRFNINSPSQLAEILFSKLMFPTKGLKKTKSGFSTAESELQKLALLGGLYREFPTKILEFRGLTKLKSTYLDTLPQMINPATLRIHSNLNQTVAETGRLSSSDPNLQNIPIRTELGRDIRKAFIPSEGRVLMSADYSQMELRILAHVTGDPALTQAFLSGRDVHAATASTLFGTPIGAVTSDQRRKAKMVNFGIDYGMTPFGLSERLGIPVGEAKSYIEKYLREFRGVARYIEEVKASVAEKGYVTTLLGRRRFIPLAQSPQKQIQEMGFRQAVNMPIQGAAADIIKIAMIRIQSIIRSLALQSRMILQIHDELLFDVVPEERLTLEEIVRKQMESAYPMTVPLTVEVSTGANWAEIHG